MTVMQKLQAKRTKKGFTLVELVIVIAILAILAAIAIPVVMSIIERANTSSGKSDAQTIDLALKSYISKIAAGYATDTTPTVAEGLADSGLDVSILANEHGYFKFENNQRVVYVSGTGTTLTGATAIPFSAIPATTT